MSTNLYLYRHAESDKNTQNRDIVAGRNNTSLLTAVGRQQSYTHLGSHMVRERRQYVAAAASLACRARGTGHLAFQAASIEVPIMPCAELQEISQGDWEGRNRHEPLRLADGSLETYTRPQSRGWDGQVSGGESNREVGERMVSAALYLGAEHPDSDVALFTHDYALRCMTAVLHNDLERLHRSVTPIPFCSETLVVCSAGQLSLEYIGRPTIPN